jgi:hypothetical protein
VPAGSCAAACTPATASGSCCAAPTTCSSYGGTRSPSEPPGRLPPERPPGESQGPAASAIGQPPEPSPRLLSAWGPPATRPRVLSATACPRSRCRYCPLDQVGKHRAGRALDGRIWHQFLRSPRSAATAGSGRRAPQHPIHSRKPRPQLKPPARKSWGPVRAGLSRSTRRWLSGPAFTAGRRAAKPAKAGLERYQASAATAGCRRPIGVGEAVAGLADGTRA